MIVKLREYDDAPAWAQLDNGTWMVKFRHPERNTFQTIAARSDQFRPATHDVDTDALEVFCDVERYGHAQRRGRFVYKAGAMQRARDHLRRHGVKPGRSFLVLGRQLVELALEQSKAVTR